MTLTEDQMRDLDALLAWAFMSRPGVPQTRVLDALWRDMRSELRAIEDGARAAA